MTLFLQLLHLLLVESSQEKRALTANHRVLTFAIHTQKREGGRLNNDVMGNCIVVPSTPGTPDRLGFAPVRSMAPLEADSTLRSGSLEGPALGSANCTSEGDVSLQERRAVDEARSSATSTITVAERLTWRRGDIGCPCDQTEYVGPSGSLLEHGRSHGRKRIA